MKLGRVLSSVLAGLGGIFALGVAAALVVLRAAATENYFPQYRDASPLGFGLGVLQVAAFAGVQLASVFRQSDAIRAALLWGASLVLLVQGFNHAGAMDVVGMWLLPAGFLGVLAAGVATVEARHPARVALIAPAFTVVAYALVWLLDRVALAV